jgi:hypothetical protein
MPQFGIDFKVMLLKLLKKNLVIILSMQKRPVPKHCEI